MNFGVRFGQVVTQSGIDCESRRDLIRILYVQVRIVAANATREVADTLQEEDRRPGEEDGARVRYWKGREYEEAVGREPLQHVDLLALISATEFQRVPAAYPGQRTGVI